MSYARAIRRDGGYSEWLHRVASRFARHESQSVECQPPLLECEAASPHSSHTDPVSRSAASIRSRMATKSSDGFKGVLRRRVLVSG